MSEDIFLIDDLKIYTYNELFSDIAIENYYYPLLKTNSLYDFFKNLIKAISSNSSITLLDSDLSEPELTSLSNSEINMKVSVDPFLFLSHKELVDKFKNSCSEITLFTSGTTGQPKKVSHSYSTLSRNSRVAEKYKGHIWAFAYNPTHMAGLQVFFQAFLNCNVLINVFGKDRNFIYSQINKFLITHISATPTFYRLLLPFENQYMCVERITFGGEKSDIKLYSSIQQIFPNAKINNIYASTEAGSLFSTYGELFKIPDNIKKLVKIQDNEILIHKSLLGYSESFIFEDGFYRTNDLIEWENESKGLFRFKNRKNELINVGGYKVNPSEIECEILKIEGIQQALVYGRKNSILGNILCADIQLISNQENSISEKDIKRQLSINLQDFKIPRIIKFVDTISMTRTGKIKRT